LDSLLGELHRKVLEAFDRGEKVSVHLHQEETCFGDPELLFDMIYQGWTFGVSVGDYPKEAFLAERLGGELKRRVPKSLRGGKQVQKSIHKGKNLLSAEGVPQWEEGVLEGSVR
jgi:hypothetical protein